MKISSSLGIKRKWIHKKVLAVGRYIGFPVKQIAYYLEISGPPVSISLLAGEKLTKMRGIKINI
jgi:hypothetical protein